ncbi:MAG: TolC family protein [Flavobacteriales bacterium]|nr:TolC family protein [Flavobacteriales bacterium]
MFNKILLTITIFTFGFSDLVQGQGQKFTLKEAVEYALQNHLDVKNKKLGEDYAIEQVNETRAIGLPQLNANVQFVNNVEKQVFVFPNPATGKSEPIRVGNTYSTVGTLSASWLAFDASYFIGLKAANAYTELVKLQTNLAERDVEENVTKSYYLVLITKENINLIDQNLKTLEDILFQTEGFYKNGFVEKIDVDRLKLTLSNLNITKKSLQDQYEVVKQLLKMNMGMNVDTEIELTQSLEELYKSTMATENSTFDVKLRVEYQLLNRQLVLNNLDKKRYEMNKIPNLALFANYVQSNFEEKIKYDTWYSNSFWGFQIGIPLFSGFNNRAQLKKRYINISQTKNSMEIFENAAKMQANQAVAKYQRSLETIELQKKNLELANEILRISSLKLKEGVGSNLEISNAQQELKASQTNYLNSIYDLLMAQLELKKAFGK